MRQDLREALERIAFGRTVTKMKKQLDAREDVAEMLWDESREKADLRDLFEELLKFEFPNQSWKHHPSPRGVQLWRRVEQAVSK